jgi:hypothetical protein
VIFQFFMFPRIICGLLVRIYKRTLAVSKAAGVKKGALLDAATLEVAVIGDERAARVFVGAHAPTVVG